MTEITEPKTEPEPEPEPEPHLYPKRGLPPSMSSRFAHGLISGHQRSPVSQRALETRKNQILRTMNAEQIEAAYQEAAKKINAILDVDNKKNEEIDREINKLKAQRELEKRLLQKQKEMKTMKSANLDGAVDMEDVES